MSAKLINLGKKLIIVLSISITLVMMIFIICSEVFYKEAMIGKKHIETKKTEKVLVTEYESLKLDYISEPENKNISLKEKLKEIDLKRLNEKINKYK